MLNATFVFAAAILAPLQGGETVQAPVIVACAPDPLDGTRALLTYEDGWWVGFASIVALDSVAIRASTTPPSPDFHDLDGWFETVAEDLVIEGGIPTPGLPEGGVGLSHGVVITGLDPQTTYYVAVRGYSLGEGLSIPVLAPAGWTILATGDPAAPPSPLPTISPESSSSGGSNGSCGASSTGAAGLLAFLGTWGLLAASKPR